MSTKKEITKVNIALYEKPIKQILRQKKYSIKFYEELVELFSNFLHCSECNEVQPKENFPKSGQFASRGGYYPRCKKCTKKIYDEGKQVTSKGGKKFVTNKKRAS